MITFMNYMLMFRRFTLLFLSFMLMFPTLMLISLDSMLKNGVLCLSTCLYAFLLMYMLIAELHPLLNTSAFL
ncbi:hypothetical protein CUU66_16640 [Peribacillus deserti]|uniref:Uncharacterized protein n=1 Tax=Peribacillus deserti TaxID=673318 RepID=A0A2N5M3J0_9BACI|nr:hypothetical protein CUU66_16640 [Peribacillus deserti]